MPPQPSAPSAPAPAPAAPSPAPTPAPAAPSPGASGGDGGSGSDGGSATDAFEKQFELGKPTSKPTPPAAPAAPKPDAKAGTPAVKPGDKPPKPEPKVEFDVEDGIEVPRYKTDKEFRGWGLSGHKKAKGLEGELTQLRTRFQELEQKVPKTEGERQKLAEQLEAIQKRHTELQQEVNYMNYERSAEYKEKYETPYHDAISRAHRDVRELTVTEEDRTQQPDGDGKYPTKERQATDGDFDEIYQMPLGPATKMAAKKFGQEAVSIVMQHRANIRQLAEKAVGALKEWKEKAGQREKDNEAQRLQTRERASNLWNQINTDIRDKNKDIFGKRDGDNDWNADYDKGTAMATDYLNNRGNRTMEQNLLFDAHIFHRVSVFPALLGKVQRLEAELAQANKDLTELRGSGPGKPGGGGGEAPADQEQNGAMDMFDKKL